MSKKTRVAKSVPFDVSPRSWHCCFSPSVRCGLGQPRPNQRLTLAQLVGRFLRAVGHQGPSRRYILPLSSTSSPPYRGIRTKTCKDNVNPDSLPSRASQVGDVDLFLKSAFKVPGTRCEPVRWAVSRVENGGLRGMTAANRLTSSRGLPVTAARLVPL